MCPYAPEFARLPLRRTFRAPVLIGVLMAAMAAPGAAAIKEWAVHVGSFNVTKNPTSAEAGFELRFPTRWPDADLVAGLAGTEDSSLWAYAGGRYTFRLDRRWGFSLGLAVSVYEDGDGKDLGGPIEFRSHYELSYATGQRSRLSLIFYHLSNAGLYDKNPGANSAVLAWSVRPGGGKPETRPPDR